MRGEFWGIREGFREGKAKGGYGMGNSWSHRYGCFCCFVGETPEMVVNTKWGMHPGVWAKRRSLLGYVV